ncbi:MAG: hypothetical protein HOQ24_13635, partial [Mycobacteriaceae bacterium]|nr:hypothetical protein [Mycobacteriaceae bacterium]
MPAGEVATGQPVDPDLVVGEPGDLDADASAPAAEADPAPAVDPDDADVVVDAVREPGFGPSVEAAVGTDGDAAADGSPPSAWR